MRKVSRASPGGVGDGIRGGMWRRCEALGEPAWRLGPDQRPAGGALSRWPGPRLVVPGGSSAGW